MVLIAAIFLSGTVLEKPYEIKLNEVLINSQYNGSVVIENNLIIVRAL